MASRRGWRQHAEPEAGTWATLVLSAPDQVEVPPPPEAGLPDAAAEAEELLELAAQRSPEREQAVARWDQQPVQSPWALAHLQVVAERAKDPLAASRGYALMSVAIYDAVVTTWHWKYVYGRESPTGVTALAAPGPDSSYPSEHAAVAGAASRLLAYLNPELPAARFDQMAEEAAASSVWAGTSFPRDVEAGLALGRAVAEEVIARAEHDGSHHEWDGTRPPGIGRGPEHWEPPPGSATFPTKPLGGSWATWVFESADQFRAPPPPAYGSAEFLEQARAVMEGQAHLTDEQRVIADFWKGGQGTPLPPGIWIDVALDYVRRDQLTTPQAARVLTLLNVAQADAGVATCDTKYTYWYPRPVNAIRDLGLDPGWESYLETPVFPSYTSGHAGYSGAAAEVLAFFFPHDADDTRAKSEQGLDLPALRRHPLPDRQYRGPGAGARGRAGGGGLGFGE